MTVPASPQSIVVDPVSSSAGVTTQVGAELAGAGHLLDAHAERAQGLDHEGACRASAAGRAVATARRPVPRARARDW